MLLYAKEVNIKMNRIREIRENKKLSLKKTTELLKSNDLLTLTPDALAKYERGDRQPNEPTWQALADFFNVSVDYLKGAYSKEEIAKISQQAYKKNYYKDSDDILIRVFSSICDDYFISSGVVPVDIKKEDKLISSDKVESLDFWKKALEELYIPYVAIRWLIEKPSLNANKKDVIDAVKGAMSAYSYSSERYDERCIFIAKHTFLRKDMHGHQAPEYIDFTRSHPVDDKFYY